jgi:aminopeptidase-like protein
VWLNRLPRKPSLSGAVSYKRASDVRPPRQERTGDAGGMTCKWSRRGNATIDRMVAHVLSHDEVSHRITRFVPYGYDERQYCSPGFDLPVGCLMRTPGWVGTAQDDQMVMLWVLNLADGHHSLLDMAERAGVPFTSIRAAADALLAAELLEPIPSQ